MIPTTAELRDLALAFVSEPVSRGEEISVPVFVDHCLAVRWENLSTEDMMRVRHALRSAGKAYAEDREIEGDGESPVSLTDAFVVTCDDCCKSDAIATVDHARTFTAAMAWLQMFGWSTFDELTRCPACTERRAGVIRERVRLPRSTKAHEVVARLGHWECDCETFRYRIGPNRTCDHIEAVKASKKEVA